MDYRVLCSIRGLKLNGIDTYKTPHFILSNDDSLRIEIFHTNDFKEKIGSANYTLPFDNKTFAVALMQATDEMTSWGRSQIANKLTEQTIYIGQHLRDFLHFLWFIKDNGICSTISIGHVQSENILMYASEISYMTNCFGDINDVCFSKQEMDLADSILKKYISICPGNPIEIHNELLLGDDEDIVPKLTTFQNLPNQNDKINNYRITRAWTFITKARLTHVLPMKIALFIPVLECLFSSESNEVTQKVSERVAFYIGNNSMERQGIFMTIKDAYNLRSKYFHGQELISKHQIVDNLKLLSLKMDYLLRKIFTKIILEDSAIFNETNQNKFDEHMSNIIFK